MYNIRQFKPTLYFVLILGVTGFSVAAQTPGLWVLSVSAILFNAWMVYSGRFMPLPAIVANVVTVGAIVVLIDAVSEGGSTPILSIAEFLVLLQIVKLFEQRANRDYAQMLILSLLLMVAAAISTPSLVFGVTFLVYLFASLYCCLLFHLKSQNDRARKQYGQPDDKINPATLEQDQHFLPRSMRRITVLIIFSALVVGAIVFLFFPRGSGSGAFSPIRLRPAQALTGFNDRVTFQKVAQITRSEEPIARVEIYENGQRVTTPQSLTLRGSALDRYTGDITSGDGRWTWLRSNDSSEEAQPQIADPFRVAPLAPAGENSIKQVITLQPTGTNKLFGIAGVNSITTDREMEVFYFQRDGVIESGLMLRAPLKYTVTSSGELPRPDLISRFKLLYPTYQKSNIDLEIRKFAQQPQVCGSDFGGALSRYPQAANYEFDGKIAANIEAYLRRNYSYTLDLTEAVGLGDRDPLVAFLTDFKKGHCEYFAGAMTLMCQSLGIPARMIVGFSCDASDFNTMGDYFLVRQSNAHAWVEVFTGSKWETFDPTTASQAAAANTGPKKGMGRLKSFFDYLEYKWDSSIIAYDQKDRTNLVGNLDYQISRTTNQTSKNVSEWWSNVEWNVSSTLISGAIAVMAIFGLGVLIWYLRGHIRLRRRVHRFGLKSLKTGEQLRLARQLGFYDDLVQLLERHQIIRPRHQTPMEFNRSLTFLPGSVYDDIIRLTRLFYRVRYGDGKLSAVRRHHVSAMVQRIAQTLE